MTRVSEPHRQPPLDDHFLALVLEKLPPNCLTLTVAALNKSWRAWALNGKPSLPAITRRSYIPIWALEQQLPQKLMSTMTDDKAQADKVRPTCGPLCDPCNAAWTTSHLPGPLTILQHFLSDAICNVCSWLSSPYPPMASQNTASCLHHLHL